VPVSARLPLVLPVCWCSLFGQVFTQISLVVLLWGTMCGGLALIHDVAKILADRLSAEQGWDPPFWLTGRSCMAAVALLVLFPLCLQRHMREVRGETLCSKLSLSTQANRGHIRNVQELQTCACCMLRHVHIIGQSQQDGKLNGIENEIVFISSALVSLHMLWPASCLC